MPMHQLIDIARSERPVRHAYRQPIDGYLAHEAVGDRFEYHRRPIEAVPACQILEFRYMTAPPVLHGGTPGVPAGAEPCAPACDSAAKKWRTAADTSSAPVTENWPLGRPVAAIS